MAGPDARREEGEYFTVFNRRVTQQTGRARPKDDRGISKMASRLFLVGIVTLLAGCSGPPGKPARTPKGGTGTGPGPGPVARPVSRPASGVVIPNRAEILKLEPTLLAVRYPVGLTAVDKKLVAIHCPFGLPKKDPKATHGETVFTIRKGYVGQHSSTRKTPLWVCEAVWKEQLGGTATREGLRFKADPKLIEYKRALNRDYRRSGFHRGQMAPCSNQTREASLKAERLMLGNVAPMKPEYRKGIWTALEEKIRGYVKARGFARVISGPLLYGPEGSESGFLFIGPNRVIVPTHFFKIVVAPGGRGRWEAIAFVMENREHDKPYEWKSYVKSIDWVEKTAGIDFMTDLSPSEEARLERKPASRVW